MVEAADILRVSPQRVHQLMVSGDLDGPVLPTGRMRFPAHAARVTRASLDQLLLARAEQAAARREQRRARELPRVGPAVSAASAPEDQQVLTARAAAQELKVKMDALRDQVRAERGRNRQLIEIAAQLLDLLKTTVDDADELDAVTDGYSSALTQLLSPEGPQPLLGRGDP